MASLFVSTVSAFASRAGPSAASVGAAFAARGSSVMTPSSRTLTSLHMADSPMDIAKKQIDSNDIMVFSKSYCPFCASTKAALEGKGFEFGVLELDETDNGDEIQAALLEMSGQKTVPNVFVKGQHLGGNDQTQLALKMGKVKKMLDA